MSQQTKCPYCDFDSRYSGKNLIDNGVFKKSEIELTHFENGYTTIDAYVHTQDISNEYEEVFTRRINYCPMCGRKLS